MNTYEDFSDDIRNYNKDDLNDDDDINDIKDDLKDKIKINIMDKIKQSVIFLTFS